MNKQNALKILNPILFISALIQLITVIISFTSYNNEFFATSHTYNGFILLALILLHIILNWPWIKVNIFKIKKN